MNEGVRQHFDTVAAGYDVWKHKAHRYYGFVKRIVREVVPPGRRVAEIGCGTGDVLASLRPSRGLGVDISSEMIAIARSKHPSVDFGVHDITKVSLSEQFDYVVAVDLVEHTLDLDKCLAHLAGSLADGGRLVITTANPRWGWILDAAERLRLKMPEGAHEWRSRDALLGAAKASCLRELSFTRDMLVPKEVPVLRRVDEASSLRPLRQRLGLIQRAVFERPG